MKLTKTIRLSEWWEFKLSPLLAIFYATVFSVNLPLLKIWQLPLLLLLSLAVGAIYVSVINDLTDIEVDRLANKPNRFADKSIFFRISVLSICLVIGIPIIYFWTTLNLLVGGFYTAAWVSYTLYSLPPFRFKNRGILGVLSDAFGAHFFPYLFVVSATFAWIDEPINFLWLILVGVWSLACGIRGILWHQVQDYLNDAASQVTTFATKYSKSTACFIGERIIFPIELVSFVFILLISGNYLGLMLLIFYFGLVWSRSAVWDSNVVIVAPHPHYQIIMNDFYSAWYPLAVFLTAIQIHPTNLIFGMVHFILFPKTLFSLFRDSVLVLWEAYRQNKNYSAPPE